MQIILQNDTVLVEYVGLHDAIRLEEMYKHSGLIIPDITKDWYVDPINPQGSPVLIGMVKDKGPGIPHPKTGRICGGEEIQIGDQIMYQVNSQIAFKEDDKIFYIIGYGNVLGVLES
jgi:co-chaperonin GroES (HSP10)